MVNSFTISNSRAPPGVDTLIVSPTSSLRKARPMGDVGHAANDVIGVTRTGVPKGSFSPCPRASGAETSGHPEPVRGGWTTGSVGDPPQLPGRVARLAASEAGLVEFLHECPAPTVFTRKPRSRAKASTSMTSSTLDTRATNCGRDRAEPAQLRHGVPSPITGRPCRRRGTSSRS